MSSASRTRLLHLAVLGSVRHPRGSHRRWRRRVVHDPDPTPLRSSRDLVGAGDLFDDAAMAVGYAYDRPPVHPHLHDAAPGTARGRSVEVAVDVGCGAGAVDRGADPAGSAGDRARPVRVDGRRGGAVGRRRALRGRRGARRCPVAPVGRSARRGGLAELRGPRRVRRRGGPGPRARAARSWCRTTRSAGPERRARRWPGRFAGALAPPGVDAGGRDVLRPRAVPGRRRRAVRRSRSR